MGFLEITNQVLDADKRNRYVSLLRQEPDKDEMKRIKNGILFESYVKVKDSINVLEFEGTTNGMF